MSGEDREDPLPFERWPPGLGRDAFLVTPSNEAAAAWIDRWPDWPGPALALHGPSGSGKSHLAAVWRQRAGAGLVEAPMLDDRLAAELAGTHAALVVEAADQASETALFHLYNMMAERRGHLLLVAREPPARWMVRLPDLRSRLGTVPLAPIGAPDDQLIRAVLIKLFDDQQLKVAPEIIDFLALRMERSFAAAERVVAAIDRDSLKRRRPITVPQVRAVLERLDDAS